MRGIGLVGQNAAARGSTEDEDKSETDDATELRDITDVERTNSESRSTVVNANDLGDSENVRFGGGDEKKSFESIDDGK